MSERLTERDEYGNADIIGVDSSELQGSLEFDQLNLVTNALNKLADYEDSECQQEQQEQKELTGAVRMGEIVTGRIIAADAEHGIVMIKWNPIATEPKGDAK